MPVDLKCRGLFSRETVLLEADQLVILEHNLFSDRIRRLGFDRVQQVAASRRVPWASVLMLALVVLLPASILLLIAANTGAGIGRFYTMIFGAALFVVGGGTLVWQLICRESRIFVTRAGQTRQLRTITPPARVQRFLDRLIEAIEQAQQRPDDQEPTAAEDVSRSS
jgi:hypothetical protein